jgi:deoxyribonuclease V
MSPRARHSWDVSPEEAVAIQNHLRTRLDLQSEPQRIETVAGVDVSYDKGSDWLFATPEQSNRNCLRVLYEIAVAGTD